MSLEKKNDSLLEEIYRVLAVSVRAFRVELFDNGGKCNQGAPMSDLTTVAAEFKKWKGNLSYCRYPEPLWAKAYELTNSHSLQAIASALGVSVHYLERKFAKRSKRVTFASVQATPSPAPT